jgi:hypothetical protein
MAGVQQPDLRQLLSVAPTLSKLVAIEEPENTADEQQQHLVEGSGNGSKSECATQADRARDAAVLNKDLDGASSSAEESARRARSCFSSAFSASLPGSIP